MTFPAYDELVDDDGITRTATKVYRWLLRKHPEALREPVVVKREVVSRGVHRAKRHVGRALELLVRRGYLLDCGRQRPDGSRKPAPRMVMIPFLRQQGNANVTNRQAA